MEPSPFETFLDVLEAIFGLSDRRSQSAFCVNGSDRPVPNRVDTEVQTCTDPAVSYLSSTWLFAMPQILTELSQLSLTLLIKVNSRLLLYRMIPLTQDNMSR